MKKKILVFLLSLFLVSCSKTPEEKAKENIQIYLIKKLGNDKSYEPIAFGKLIPKKSSYKDEVKYLKLIKEYKYGQKKTADLYDLAVSTPYSDTMKIAMQKHDTLIKFQEILLEDIHKFKKLYKQKNIFIMEHSYKSRNKMGSKTLNKVQVTFGKTLKIKNMKPF